jgi:phosphatidylethanolamine-binding protein (PEBP) family uncharacterized protein
MTLAEIKDLCMFQTNNDTDDIEDYEPFIVDYVNDGYDQLVNAWDKTHTPTETYARLEEDEDVPNLPEWTHQYLADWATWLIYRNGNPQKQQRGFAFRDRFLRLVSQLLEEGGRNGAENGRTRKFINIPA